MRTLGSVSNDAGGVSTLVLMDSWINAMGDHIPIYGQRCFNPCFNGFMDKCRWH